MRKRISCAFTGHRPRKFPWKDNEADVRCITLKAKLTAQIMQLVEKGVTDFLSGMAEGVDTWAAQSVLELRKENPTLKLHCILPCKTQADEWSNAARKQYRSILEQADSIVYVSRDYCKDCMLKRNHFLVDKASILLVVCLNPGERRGGTAATVRYARKQGKDIILLNPLTLSVTYETPTDCGQSI